VILIVSVEPLHVPATGVTIILKVIGAEVLFVSVVFGIFPYPPVGGITGLEIIPPNPGGYGTQVNDVPGTVEIKL
jgi:hypothetical protein